MGKEDKGVREIEAQYIEAFKQLEDPESQCEYLLQLGMRLQQEEGTAAGCVPDRGVSGGCLVQGQTRRRAGYILRGTATLFWYEGFYIS